MITSTITFAMHILASSFRVLGPVSQVLEFVLPYRNMATKAVKGKININTKHLKKGDPFPKYNGKLRVYNMRYCPYAQRTILALNAKELDYEVVNINLKDKPEWLFSVSPLGKVPSLEIKENVTVYESLVTVEYLDEVYPQRPLLPKDPLRRAHDKILVEACSPVNSLFMKIIRFPEQITEDNINGFHSALDFVQNELKIRGTKFLFGDEPGYADYMTWPWFERILAIQGVQPAAAVDAQKYKLLLEYFDNMLKDPAVSQYLVPKETLFEVLETYKTGGMPNYDLLLEN